MNNFGRMGQETGCFRLYPSINEPLPGLVGRGVSRRARKVPVEAFILGMILVQGGDLVNSMAALDFMDFSGIHHGYRYSAVYKMKIICQIPDH